MGGDDVNACGSLAEGEHVGNILLVLVFRLQGRVGVQLEVGRVEDSTECEFVHIDQSSGGPECADGGMASVASLRAWGLRVSL